MQERTTLIAITGVYTAETGFQLAHDPDTVQAPDLASVRRERVRPFGPKQPAYYNSPLDLAVEVISPNDTYTEVDATVRTWLTYSTPVVVVIDPRQRRATLHRPAAGACQSTA